MSGYVDTQLTAIAALEAEFAADPVTFRGSRVRTGSNRPGNWNGAGLLKAKSINDRLTEHPEVGPAYASAVARVQALIRGH